MAVESAEDIETRTVQVEQRSPEAVSPFGVVMEAK